MSLRPYSRYLLPRVCVRCMTPNITDFICMDVCHACAADASAPLLGEGDVDLEDGDRRDSRGEGTETETEEEDESDEPPPKVRDGSRRRGRDKRGGCLASGSVGLTGYGVLGVG